MLLRLKAMSASLTPRLWDSELFRFPVAEINLPELDEPSLVEVLRETRRNKIELVYWRTAPHREVSHDLLDRFAGQLVDRRLTYHLSLCGINVGGPAASSEKVNEFPIGPPSPDLVELALAAGAFSRFKIDHRLPATAFEALYRTWIERSSRHEIADAVFVASSSDGGMQGMCTISVQSGSGVIGLVSVHKHARGRGIGRNLMAAGHCWMADRGLADSLVVTQECNKPAGALYERCGYRVVDRSLIYHFWPLK